MEYKNIRLWYTSKTRINYKAYRSVYIWKIGKYNRKPQKKKFCSVNLYWSVRISHQIKGCVFLVMIGNVVMFLPENPITLWCVQSHYKGNVECSTIFYYICSRFNIKSIVCAVIFRLTNIYLIYKFYKRFIEPVLLDVYLHNNNTSVSLVVELWA